MKFRDFKRICRKIWHFIWEDNSIWSWIVNVILAFILIKFVVYPGLGLILHTTHPIVAVVSSSMEHKGNFDAWWDNGGGWYVQNNIAKEQFFNSSLRNGFNKGDIIILRGKKAADIRVGDIIVFISHRERPKADPIIHRVVRRWEVDGKYYFQTKGDNYRTNRDSMDACDSSGCVNERDIREDQVIGTTVARIPMLGYVKIWFVELVKLFVK